MLQIGLNPPRQRLYEFIDQRVTEMFATGLVVEVQGICSTFGPDLKPLQSLGYVQTISYLRGEISLAEAVALTQRQTCQYAKRQLTWFRRDKNMHWFEGFGSEPLVRGAARDLVSKFLSRFQSERIPPCQRARQRRRGLCCQSGKVLHVTKATSGTRRQGFRRTAKGSSLTSVHQRSQDSPQCLRLSARLSCSR